MMSSKQTGKGKDSLLPADSDIEALTRAEHPDPFSVLGPHADGEGGQYIRAFLPGAVSVNVLARDDGQVLGSLEDSQVAGLYVGHFAHTRPYVLQVDWGDAVQISEDPYSFGPLLDRKSTRLNSSH